MFGKKNYKLISPQRCPLGVLYTAHEPCSFLALSVERSLHLGSTHRHARVQLQYKCHVPLTPANHI